MNKTLIHFLLTIFLLSFSFGSFATENSEVKYNEKGQIILQTIETLEKSGYITTKNANDAKKEMVFNQESLIKYQDSINKTISENEVKNNEVSFTDFFSFIGFLKFAGIVMLLIAAKGIVFKFIKVIALLPPILYQSIFLTASVFLTFYPETVTVAQSFYLSVFCIFMNVIIFASIVAVYPFVFLKILSSLSFKIKPEILIPFYLTAYFGFFTLYLESQFIGIFTLISFVSMFGFTMGTSGLCTWIGYEKDDYINSSLFINGVIVVLYSLAHIYDINIPYIEFFSVGIQYVCGLVFAITLLIYSSFFYEDDEKFAIFVFFMLLFEGLSLTALYLFNLPVIPVIMNTVFFIFALEWIGYLSSKASGIVMAFTLGLSLWGVGILLESYPEIFVTSLF